MKKKLKKLSVVLIIAITSLNAIPAFAYDGTGANVNTTIIPYKGINIVVSEYTEQDGGKTQGYDIDTDFKNVPGAYSILVDYVHELKQNNDEIAQEALANEPALLDVYDVPPKTFSLYSGDPAYNTQAIESSRMTWRMRVAPKDVYIMLTGARILYGYNNNPVNPAIEMWETIDFAATSANSITISWPLGFGISSQTKTYMSPKTAKTYGSVQIHNFGAENVKLVANSATFYLSGTYTGKAYCYFGTHEGRTTSDWNTFSGYEV